MSGAVLICKYRAIIERKIPPFASSNSQRTAAQARRMSCGEGHRSPLRRLCPLSAHPPAAL